MGLSCPLKRQQRLGRDGQRPVPGGGGEISRRPGSTPSPADSTTPAPSLCGITRGNGIDEPGQPRRLLMSPGFTPQTGDPDPQLARPGSRRRLVGGLQHLGGRPVPVIPDSAHGHSL